MLAGNKLRMTDAWKLKHEAGPVIATAIHAGHDLRPEIAAKIAIDEPGRLREEDPYTDGWADIAPTRVTVQRSRFEVDLNRPRDAAVYVTPEQAWGLQVWREPLPDEAVERSLAQHDAFYAMLHRVLSQAQRRHGRFVVYDLHSYNHRRGGPGAGAEDPEANPEINVGTGTMDRDRWSGVVDRFIADLRAHEVDGRRLDVRENVKFQGGYLPTWVHETFPDSGCALAIEVKKFFMDEHTGELDQVQHKAVHRAVEATVPGILEELGT